MVTVDYGSMDKAYALISLSRGKYGRYYQYVIHMHGAMDKKFPGLYTKYIPPPILSQ